MDDGGTRRCQFATAPPDVQWPTFREVHSVGRTDFLTPSEVLVEANAGNATYGSGGTVHSWIEEPYRYSET